jgi:two-component system sensor histidine kinase DegS
MEVKSAGKREKGLFLLMAEERESKRIARELHHDLYQSLSLINGDITRVIREIENDQVKSGVNLLRTIVQRGQQVATQVQKLGMHIWPPVLADLGFLVFISWFCKEFQKAQPRIHIKLQTEIQEEDVPDFLKSVVYKILQGAFSNIAEHSKAELVLLCLVKKGVRIEMMIRDNGRGFDLKKVQKGLGLESMREWVSISGGSFHIKSAEGKGTTISASWSLGGEG